MYGGWTQGQREVPGDTKPLVVEPQVQYLGLEDPLEKKMATHSSILGLGTPTDRGGWQATVLGVAKNQTRLSD